MDEGVGRYGLGGRYEWGWGWGMWIGMRDMALFFFLKWGVGKKGGQYNLLSSISNSPPIK